MASFLKGADDVAPESTESLVDVFHYPHALSFDPLSREPVSGLDFVIYAYRGYFYSPYVIFVVKVSIERKQEKPAVADKPARRLRKVCTVYVKAVGL